MVTHQILTMAMIQIAEAIRLTNAFSKKVQDHVYARTRYSVFYNFARIYKTLQCGPANGGWFVGSAVVHGK